MLDAGVYRPFDLARGDRAGGPEAEEFGADFEEEGDIGVGLHLKHRVMLEDAGEFGDGDGVELSILTMRGEDRGAAFVADRGFETVPGEEELAIGRGERPEFAPEAAPAAEAVAPGGEDGLEAAGAVIPLRHADRDEHRIEIADRHRPAAHRLGDRGLAHAGEDGGAVEADLGELFGRRRGDGDVEGVADLATGRAILRSCG